MTPLKLTAEVVGADLSDTRRSSGSSSASDEGSGGSPMSRRRFLKLGPVHYGESSGSDWSEGVLVE